MRSRLLFTLLFAALAAGCPPTEPVCDAEADADGDGIDNCAEEAAGTDPENADSDGDGFADNEEMDCVSDPLDADEVCYGCGWQHNDPGDLTDVGRDAGDTIANFPLWDQCGEEVALWDMAAEYHILFVAAAW